MMVEAFFNAARAGDFETLLALLDPDVVVHADRGAVAGGWNEVRGAAAVAEQAATLARFTVYGKQALVNGAAGIVAAHAGRVYSIAAFTIREGRIVEIDIFADADRLQQMDLQGFVP
jgi:ketosteroid isomerase-like protein